VWDATAGTLVASVRHPFIVTRIAFMHDLPRVITASGDKVFLHALPGGELVDTLEGHTDAVLAIATVPGDQLIVTAARDHTVRVWSATTPQLLQLHPFTAVVPAIAADARGQRLAVVASDGMVTVLRVSTEGWDRVARAVDCIPLELAADRIVPRGVDPACDRP
jgi:WD40 repeat protein